ncbi:unnamed protein product [Vicia faba]|uniref:Uncharacterized protein n=1 Tax=Vicia faba TaxID=3906 RepID=A0AAV0ZVZ2_VICFA|nr:unnamed protein product [Vicia faba]
MHVEPMVNEDDPTFIENVGEPNEMGINSNAELNVEPHVRPSSAPYVEPHTDPASRKTIVDLHAFDTHVNDILDEDGDSSKDSRDENPRNEEPGVQGERNGEAGEVDDIPIANI